MGVCSKGCTAHLCIVSRGIICHGDIDGRINRHIIKVIIRATSSEVYPYLAGKASTCIHDCPFERESLIIRTCVKQQANSRVRGSRKNWSKTFGATSEHLGFEDKGPRLVDAEAVRPPELGERLGLHRHQPRLAEGVLRHRRRRRRGRRHVLRVRAERLQVGDGERHVVKGDVAKLNLIGRARLAKGEIGQFRTGLPIPVVHSVVKVASKRWSLPDSTILAEAHKQVCLPTVGLFPVPATVRCDARRVARAVFVARGVVCVRDLVFGTVRHVGEVFFSEKKIDYFWSIIPIQADRAPLVGI